jgi:hypothetical protein
MMFDQLRTLPDTLVAGLDPVRVQEYVRAAGWAHKMLPGNGHTALYQRPEAKREQLLIPLTRELSDFVPRMAEAVTYLAQFEKRPALEVLGDLLLPESDILRFREASSAAAGGDVPFDHGLSLLSGARKTLQAAACSVLRPRQSFHSPMNLADTDPFLSQCRLGQTERPSFVLTVACPVNAIPSAPSLFTEVPFTRQVTGLLMASLARLAHALEVADPDAVLRAEESAPVLSANLCEGLLEMTPEGNDSALTISASYSRTVPQPHESPLPTSIRLRRDFFPQIEYLAGKLRPAATAERQHLIGFVETLNGRPLADNRPEGQVILRVVTPEGEILRAKVDLNAEDYARADKAHMRTLPVSLEGVLRQAGRMCYIDRVSEFVPFQPGHPTGQGSS